MVVFLVLLDQVSKLLVYGYIKPNHSIVINDFFSLTHVHNYGAAFSFLADQSGWQRYFLIGVSSIASIGIMIWMWFLDKTQSLKLIALSLLLAGAIGNLSDRVWLGFVLVFFDFHYHDFYWPVFNIADILIALGVVFLLFVDMRKT